MLSHVAFGKNSLIILAKLRKKLIALRVQMDKKMMFHHWRNKQQIIRTSIRFWNFRMDKITLSQKEEKIMKKKKNMTTGW